jgi:hypothetical protein
MLASINKTKLQPYLSIENNYSVIREKVDKAKLDIKEVVH